VKKEGSRTQVDPVETKKREAARRWSAHTPVETKKREAARRWSAHTPVAL